jgi:dephospho-CoA kinase
VRRALIERWGDEILREGEVDRGRVGEIVFGGRKELAWLESVLHPRVVAEQQRWLAGVTARIAAIEVPLLYETGAEGRCDAVVVITAPENVREARTTVGDAARRAERLLPDDEKIKRADFAYVNDGSIAELDAFVADVVAKLASELGE